MKTEPASSAAAQKSLLPVHEDSNGLGEEVLPKWQFLFAQPDTNDKARGLELGPSVTEAQGFIEAPIGKAVFLRRVKLRFATQYDVCRSTLPSGGTKKVADFFSPSKILAETS